MGGPIAIAQQTQSIWQGGWAHALYVMATLSLGLGFFNLLPLPILDGGKVVLELIQWATGRPLPPRVRSFLSIGAVMAIGTLMVFLSWQDILRIPSVARFFGY
jgi:regulator of sigma E protease